MLGLVSLANPIPKKELIILRTDRLCVALSETGLDMVSIYSSYAFLIAMGGVSVLSKIRIIYSKDVLL